MRVCATYGLNVPLNDGAEMQEIRLDTFDTIPDGIGKDSIITLCGKDISAVPGSFEGLVDVGNNNVCTKHRIIRSVHDFERTPSSEEILKLLNDGNQEISKGAFTASSFRDLASLLDASKALDRKHVLLCMGDIGRITRLRQNVLRNEFTFGYVGEPTASGQFSYDELRGLGDDCTVLGIIGHPLHHSKSPLIQNAAMSAEGINGTYLTFDSEDLDRVEDVIRGYNIRGANVTIPYKQRIVDHLDIISSTAEKVGAVNTIVNDDGRLSGENTDVIGITDAMKDIDTKGQKILIMGSGGAARAAAYAFEKMGSEISIAGRNHTTVKQICDDFDTSEFNGNVASYDIIVNCTPIGIIDGRYPIDIRCLDRRQTVFDMVYGVNTQLVTYAKMLGCRIVDGEDMLVGQGAASFRLWFGKGPDEDVMRGALR